MLEKEPILHVAHEVEPNSVATFPFKHVEQGAVATAEYIPIKHNVQLLRC